MGCSEYECRYRNVDAIKNRVLPREVSQVVMVPMILVSGSLVRDVGKKLRRDEPVIFASFRAD